MSLGDFSHLPHELLIYGILHQLKPLELSKAASISSEFRDMVHTEDLWKDLCISWFDGDFMFGNSWRETYFYNFKINSSNTDSSKNNGSFSSTNRKRKREQDSTSKIKQSIQSNIDADLTQFCGTESIIFFSYTTA